MPIGSWEYSCAARFRADLLIGLMLLGHASPVEVDVLVEICNSESNKVR